MDHDELVATLEGLMDLHPRFYGMLIEKIREDRYPSSTMMDLVEQGLQFDEARDYLEVLMEKLEGDRFPSVPMMHRLVRLIG
jgi:hypothetical protein